MSFTMPYGVPQTGLPTAPQQGAQQTSPSSSGAYAPVMTQDQSFGTTSQVQNAPTPAAYMQAIQAQMAPAFQQSQQQLNAQQEAMGTLTSGAGNYGDQQLTAQDNATLAGMEAPLIQQGFAQQATANEQNAAANNATEQAGLNRQQSNNQFNAGATDAYNTDLQNQYFTGGQNQINNNLQSQEFNDNLLAGIYNNNQNAQNNLQLAELGYGNSDYQQQVGLQGGLVSQGLSGAIGTTNQGQEAQNSNYMGTQQSTNPYAASIGSASAVPGYETGGMGYGLSNPYAIGADTNTPYQPGGVGSGDAGGGYNNTTNLPSTDGTF